MDRLEHFRQERIKDSYWPWKGTTDSLLAFLGILAIALSGVTFDGLDACTPGLALGNCENLTIFSYACLIVGCIFLTFPLVRSTELAWSMREAITGTAGSATFIEGTSSLSPTSFGEMWLRSGAPSYFWRVIMAIVNGLRFILILPFQVICCTQFKSASYCTEMKQWICFMPSILLVFVQYLLLYVLLKQSDGVLDALLATVSLQIFVELSRHFVQIAFDRERSSGELILPYTAPFTDETKLSAYIMDQLCVNQMLDVNYRLPLFAYFVSGDRFPLVLGLLCESLKLLKIRQPSSIHLKFTGKTAAFFDDEDVIVVAVQLFQLMNRFKKCCLTLESEDFQNFQNLKWLQQSPALMESLQQMELLCTDGRKGQALNPNANYETQVRRPTDPFDHSRSDLEAGKESSDDEGL